MLRRSTPFFIHEFLLSRRVREFNREAGWAGAAARRARRQGVLQCSGQNASTIHDLKGGIQMATKAAKGAKKKAAKKR